MPFFQVADANSHQAFDYGIGTLKLSGIVAESAVENVGSVRVMGKIGMQFASFGELRGRKTVHYRQPKEPID
jgi:hypothetical protein